MYFDTIEKTQTAECEPRRTKTNASTTFTKQKLNIDMNEATREPNTHSNITRAYRTPSHDSTSPAQASDQHHRQSRVVEDQQPCHETKKSSTQM